MVETYSIVYTFVKQKSLNSSINAEDENKLTKFLSDLVN